MAKKNFAVLITAHNRRATTLQCLERLYQASLPLGWDFSVFLVDDGSSDGTSGAVKGRYARVTVMDGDGSLYWNGGMRMAFDAALAHSFDGYLFLNDDTLLKHNALIEILSLHQWRPDALIVGAVCDPISGAWTYGGAVQTHPMLRPLRIKPVEPSGTAQVVHVANGNVLFIPGSVAEKVGNLDPAYIHGMGDTDYSLRAKAAGVTMFTTSEFVGECSRNSVRGTYRDFSLAITKRYRHAFSAKGVPVRPWLHFCKGHCGPFWPLHFLWPYIRIAVPKWSRAEI